MSSIDHAKRELAFLLEPEDGSSSTDSMNQMIHDNILEIIETFAKQGHSGFSASYAISLLIPLLKQEPIGPLTGDDSEWDDVSFESGEIMFHNNRCTHVFKGADGVAYDINGKVFVQPDGSSYTNNGSRVDIEFPYTPTTVYVNVDDDGNEL